MRWDAPDILKSLVQLHNEPMKQLPKSFAVSHAGNLWRISRLVLSLFLPLWYNSYLIEVTDLMT